MSSKKTVGNQGPTSVEHERSDEHNGEHNGEHESDQGGGQPGRGQNGGARKGNSPTAIIAGQDGPQTGGHERGNPGVGG